MFAAEFVKCVDFVLSVPGNLAIETSLWYTLWITLYKYVLLHCA